MKNKPVGLMADALSIDQSRLIAGSIMARYDRNYGPRRLPVAPPAERPMVWETVAAAVFVGCLMAFVLTM